MRTERSALAVRTAVLAAAAATVLLQCGEEQTKPALPNERPTARITAGASSSDPSGIDYRVDFQWVGTDLDGAVVGFEWAVDDTVTETAWKRTARHGEHIEFTATTPVPGRDSLLADWHSFYLRAVDDDSARSTPDARYFNARTVAPVTRITRPEVPASGELELRQPVRVEWTGEDADGPDGRPVAYEYKLVRLPPGAFPSSDPEVYSYYLRTGDNVLITVPGPARKNWVRVPEAVRAVDLDSLAAFSAYVFGVRAIDAAGAVEPRMEVARNFFAFVYSPAVEQPRFVIQFEGSGFGVVRVPFPDAGGFGYLDVPAGIRLDVSWWAEPDGGPSFEWSWAFDPLSERDFSDWSDQTRLEEPIEFPPEDLGTVHTFCMRARLAGDDPRPAGRGCVRLRVIGTPFERFALVVDDARFQVAITDPVHDAFLNDVFLRRLRDYGEVDHRTIFQGTSEVGEPEVIRPEELMRYRHVIWSCEPRNLRSGIAYDLNDGQNNNNRSLAAYVAFGGRLFLFGGRSGGMERSDFGYPVSPPSGPHDPKSDMLYYRFLHLRDWIVSAACAEHPACDACYGYVSGLVGARSLNPAFPDLTLDGSKWDPWEFQELQYRGGLKSWEGSMHLGGGELEKVPGLDSLYAAVTWDHAMLPECSVPSPVSGAICAVRYESTPQDTLENRAHGRTIGFLFQPYWFLPDQIQSAGTAAIEWLVRGK